MNKIRLNNYTVTLNGKIIFQIRQTSKEKDTEGLLGMYVRMGEFFMNKSMNKSCPQVKLLSFMIK